MLIKARIQVIAITCLLVFSLALSQEAWRTCIAVIDGDTIVLDGNERVRLIGVDTPETKDPRKPVQHFGKEAYAFTKKLVEGLKVRLDYDLNKKDKYGRTLAYVYLEDGTFLNAEIIRKGYGFAYRHFLFKYYDDFKEYEREAREKGIGLWADVEGMGALIANEDDNPIVYITRTGKKYHREGCRALKSSKIPITLKEACDRGYTACSLCDPPKLRKVNYKIDAFQYSRFLLGR